MEVKDVKKPLTHKEQIQKMLDRGCIIDDESEAVSILERINHYRLSAYFLPFKDENDRYKDGTNLKTVFKIHEFDRELSRLLFNIIVSIELKLRAQISYYHAHTYGALGYTDSQNFNKRHNHKRFMESIERNINHNDKQLFVRHHKRAYGGKFPLWAIIELFSLGELSYFYSDMEMSDRKAIAAGYETTPKNLSSWLLCLTYLRNYCAHYSRLYFNNFPPKPATPENFPYTLEKTVFDYILVLKFLCCRNKEWCTSFAVQLEALIEEYRDYIQLEHIGFPGNWAELVKWG
ncbi:MAG: Abi family protein [Oscillospiraceae bacterium]|nr:Abi family protein [Oscillospiraceae bacterium]